MSARPNHHERKVVQCPSCRGTDVRVTGGLTRLQNGLSAVPVECRCGKRWDSKASCLVLPLELEQMRRAG